MGEFTEETFKDNVARHLAGEEIAVEGLTTETLAEMEVLLPSCLDTSLPAPAPRSRVLEKLEGALADIELEPDGASNIKELFSE